MVAGARNQLCAVFSAMGLIPQRFRDAATA